MDDSVVNLTRLVEILCVVIVFLGVPLLAYYRNAGRNKMFQELATQEGFQLSIKQYPINKLVYPYERVVTRTLSGKILDQPILISDTIESSTFYPWFWIFRFTVPHQMVEDLRTLITWKGSEYALQDSRLFFLHTYATRQQIASQLGEFRSMKQ